MNSRTTRRFRELFAVLPDRVVRQAREALVQFVIRVENSPDEMRCGNRSTHSRRGSTDHSRRREVASRKFPAAADPP